VVDCLVAKSLLALDVTGLATLCVGGGVAANARLREELQRQTARRGVRLVIAPLRLCTDNAAMIAAAAFPKFERGDFADWTLRAQANLPLA
jgi:N6-L-threonylcarbamoyladenine synthase